MAAGVHLTDGKAWHGSTPCGRPSSTIRSSSASPGSYAAIIAPLQMHLRSVANIGPSTAAKERPHTCREGAVEALDDLVDLRFSRAPAETEPDRPHPDSGRHAHRAEDGRELD